MNVRKTLHSLAIALIVVVAGSGPLAVPVLAAKGAEVTLNLKDADLNTLIATVSEVTGKNFIVDPRVRGKVTVISSSPMDAAAVYATFLAVLQVEGFAAIPAGQAIKIVPETNARTEGGGLISGGVGVPGDAVVTHVYSVQNVSASQLVAILRPLISQSGHFAAYTGNNSLIISDRASNVERIEKLIAKIDQAGDRQIDVIKLKNAAAADVVRILTGLGQAAKQADPTAQQSIVIADERSNSVLIGGEQADRQRMADIIKSLDAPQASGGDTQVIYLKYASAENLAPILEGYAQNAASTSGSRGAGPVPGGAPAAPVVSSGGGGANGTRVIADKDTNSLVITASPKDMQSIRSVIAQLDIKRKQVLVEAIVAEVSATKTSQLGLDYAAYNPNTGAVTGILNSSTQSALSNIGSAVSSGTSGSGISSSTLIGAAASLIGQGATAAAGGFTSGGSFFAVLLRALASDGDTNILSTPQLTTLDNEEAKFSAGQEVPFLTGSFSNTGGGGNNGAVNPFQTIERKEVGLKLGITPTISQGNTIKLKIDLESSSIATGGAGTASLITNKRTVTNSVAIESDQVLFIGGLVDDQLNDTVNRIPLLSSIPVIGSLFKSRSLSKTKRNLMIFIHPVILSDRDSGDYYSRKRYDGVRNAEIKAANGAVPLGAGSGGRPLLIPFDEYEKQAHSRGAAPAADSAIPEESSPAADGAAAPAPADTTPAQAPAPPASAPAPAPGPP